MAKRVSIIKVYVDVLALMKSKIQAKYTNFHNEPYPHPIVATHYFTKDNKDFTKIREMLRENGCQTHPKNIYERILKYVNTLDYISAEEPIKWNNTSIVNADLIKFIDPNSNNIIQFINNNSKELEPEVLKIQQSYIDEYYAELNKGNAPRQLQDVYHLYVSKAVGFKIGILGIYDDHTMKLILKGEDSIEYASEGYEDNGVIRHVRFNKVNQKISSKKKDLFHEFSFYLFTNKKVNKIIFWEGVYSCINTNNRSPLNPSLVAGPFIMERMDINDLSINKLNKDWFANEGDVSRRIVAKIANQRIEYLNGMQFFPNIKISEQKEEELKILNTNNKNIVNPNNLLGKHVLLIYSPTNAGIRKLTFELDEKFVLHSKALKMRDEERIVEYIGKIEKFKNGTLEFKSVNSTEPLNFISGILEYKSANKPMYGTSNGVFVNSPKLTPIILLKEDSEIKKIIDFDNPEIIALESDTFKKLDKHFNSEITSFFSGESKTYMINNTSEKVKPLKLILNQRLGKYKDIVGIYEQYYLDYYSDSFRKDYVQVLPTGELHKVGRYYYEGMIDKSLKNVTFQLNSKEYGLRPILGNYNISNDPDDNVYFVGSFSDIKEQQRDIISSRDVWQRISKVPEDKETFFQRSYTIFKRGDDTWKELPNFVKEKLSQGPLFNRIISSVHVQDEKSIGNSLFRSSCFLAQSDNFSDKMEALKELKLAIENGFNDVEKLRDEVKPDRIFYYAKENIDVDNLIVRI